MALRDRVYSLETEYAINFYSQDGQGPGEGGIIEVLSELVSEDYGLSNSSFFVNGSKLAYDVGHAEWSLPECRSAYEAAAYDKAADHLLIKIAPQANKRLAANGHEGHLIVTKNNVDSFGHSYGCHENYQMQRDAALLTQEEFIRYIAQSLVPFLVSRQIFTGAGRLVVASPPNSYYELSQRASFIEMVVSGDTTRERPIFNLGREGEPFASGNSRRVHLILGDANLSGWAIWIKLGTTGLLLRLIEDLFIGPVPILIDPVAALQTISRDLAGTVTVPLRDGGQMTALDIQWEYYDLVDEYLTLFGATSQDEALMEAWGKALEDFGHDPMLLRDRADWAIKKQMLDVFARQQGFSLDELPTDRRILTDLQAFDLRYHELSGEGLYHRLYQPDTLITAAEVHQAQESPPPHTRARLRGEAIRMGRQYDLAVRVERWMDLSFEKDLVNLDHPLEFDHPLFVEWEQPWLKLEADVRLRPRDSELRSRLGKCYLSQGRDAAAVDALRATVDLAPDDMTYESDLAGALLLTGQYAQAVEWFERVTQVGIGGPGYSSDLNGLGDAHRFQLHFASAIECYRRALQINTDSVEALTNLGTTHLKQGDIDAAFHHFQNASVPPHAHPMALVGLAVIHTSRGQHRQAAVLYASATAQLLESGNDPMFMKPARRYFEAVIALAQNIEGGLSLLQQALANQTPRAAEGMFAIEPLIALLAAVPDHSPNIDAALALVKDLSVPAYQPDSADQPMSAPGADWLREAFTHPDTAIRLQAIRYTEWRTDETVRLLLIECAQNDPDEQVRRAAVLALGNPALPGREATMQALMTCLHDTSLPVRWAAQSSLEKLSRPEPLPAAVGPDANSDDELFEW